MKCALIGGVVLFPITAGAALALDCGFNTTASPDNTAYSVIFNDFSATADNPSTCNNVNVPIAPLPVGTIVVYSADYRGFGNDGDVVQTTVSHDGTVDQATVAGPYDFFTGPYLSHTIHGSGDTIPSDITLAILSYTDPLTFASLDTIDYLEVARTTTGNIQASLDALSTERTGVVVHLDATADLVSGAGQPFSEGNSFGTIGGVGSATLGIGARMSLADGFSLSVGGAYVDQAAGGATSRGLLFTSGVRYVQPGAGMVRPFAEIGARAAPQLALTLTRSYATGTGTSTASGSTTGTFAGFYGKAGVLFAPDPTNDFVFAATLSKDWLQTGAYTETMTGTNLFAASTPAQTSGFTTVKAGVDWTTHAFALADITLSGAIGHTFADNGVAANVAFAGPFTGAAQGETFVEYGARATYDLTPSSTLGLFVFGASGENSGTHAQVGADLHVKF